MTPEQEQAIRATLNKRRDAVFRDTKKQDDFVRLTRGLMASMNPLWGTSDPDVSRSDPDFPKLRRGDKLRTLRENQSRFLAQQLSTAFVRIFEKEAKAHERGAFYDIINDILIALELPELGPDALKNVLIGKI